MEARPHLPEEDRASETKPDDERDDDHHGCEERQDNNGERDIEHAFQCSWIAHPTTLSTTTHIP